MQTIKLVFGIGLLVAGAYVGCLVIPPYFENYQFEDTIQNTAVLESYSTKSADDIRTSIYKRAQELQIPISPEQIVVQKGTTTGVMIQANYSVHVDIPGYPLDLDFHPASKNQPIPGAGR
jgi:hypothetical protein